MASTASSSPAWVVREFFGLSYRRAEALLADSPGWLAEIGLAKAPCSTLAEQKDAILSR